MASNEQVPLPMTPERALAWLRAGVETYISHATQDPTWLAFEIGMDFEGKSWLVKIVAWSEYERDKNTHNARVNVLNALRSFLETVEPERGIEGGVFDQMPYEYLIDCLAEYDRARVLQ